VEAFRRIGGEEFPAVLSRKWTKWEKVATLESVRSESREQPVPMLRGLAASRMRSRGIQQKVIDEFLCAKHRTLAAGRRRHYQRKFEALFGRPYENLFHAEWDRTPILPIGVGIGNLV
jgi:hypothetical protein